MSLNTMLDLLFCHVFKKWVTYQIGQLKSFMPFCSRTILKNCHSWNYFLIELLSKWLVWIKKFASCLSTGAVFNKHLNVRYIWKCIWKKCANNETMEITSSSIYKTIYGNDSYLLLFGKRKMTNFSNCIRIVPFTLK